VLIVQRAERADRLLDELAAHLGGDDPFAPDVVAVPTRGIERWVTQQLAVRAGICANVRFPSPREVVADAVARASGIDPQADPWQPARAAWALVEVIDAHLHEEWMATLRRHLDRSPEPQARRLGVARRLARLLHRYAHHRPAMVQAWAQGRLVDDAGRPLPADLVWQAQLWRLLRDRLADVPHPAARVDDACARLVTEPELVDLPGRVSVFGLTRLPAGDLQVLRALAQQRELHLLLLHPSPALWDRLADAAPAVRRRAEDPTVGVPRHPLLASWGRDVRELQLLLGPGTPSRHHGAIAASETLLGRLQRQIRDDVAVGTPEPPGPGDRSLQVHACHGRARQVEVLRDCVLGLLADDPTLEPRDVLVMCPDIEDFAPLISATFGAGRVDPEDDDAGDRPAGLRVRLADRAVRQTNPVLATVTALMDLVAGRVAASAVLDLADREPVRRRFGLDDDDLGRLERWVAGTGVRWGLEAGHRAPFRLDVVGEGTWRAGLDRILLGAAIAEDGGRLWHGTLPLDDVDSGAIDLAGRFAELVDRLDDARERLGRPQPIGAWAQAIADAADAVADPGPRNAWQRAELHRILDELVREAAASADVDVTPAEVRELLADRLAGRPTRANFRTGALTVCTLMPMRSVPHRVVCLLGLDDGAFPRAGTRDGDDLLLRDPCLGEPDVRSEDRQLLLDAVMAATGTLVVTYTGNDERTNAPRPPAVPVTELLDAVEQAAGAAGRAAVVTRHPLQPFDPANFRAGVPWSFDRGMGDGAAALRGARRAPAAAPLAEALEPLAEDTIALDDLVRFVEHPVKAFLRQRLGVRISDLPDEVADELTLEADGLAKYAVGDRLLRARLAGTPDADAVAAERARGQLPPAGELQRAVLADVGPCVVAIARQAETVLPSPGAGASRDVRVVLPDGRRLAGTVGGVAGDTLQTVSYATLRARHRLAAWVRLLALVAAGEPVERAVVVGRYRSGGAVSAFATPEEGDRAAWALDQLKVLVSLRDRGLREPLPLACETAAAFAAAAPRGTEAAIRAATGKWASTFTFPGEDRDPEHDVAFGGVLTFEQLWLRARPGSDGHFATLATGLWEGPRRWERT